MRRARLHVLLARASSRAVIFRRGPTKHVLLLLWDTQTDAITQGQWLKGRIYERRCDLSPEGDLLLYFAAKHKAPYGSWSAISRPPYLTALALWPKGDCWGGGGHFESRHRVALNHRVSQMNLAEGFRLPKWLSVHSFGEHSGAGEDNPVWALRLLRDGWLLVKRAQVTNSNLNAELTFPFNPPVVWKKHHPLRPELSLEMEIHGLNDPNVGWYALNYHLIDSNGDPHLLERSDWAEWANSGDLLFSVGGVLFRLRYSEGKLAAIPERERVVDLTNLSFTECQAPAEALQWPRSQVRHRRRPTAARN